MLRILRVLRPLRLLQRDPGMKLVITSLIKTMPSVVDVTAVVLVFHLVFAIIGMQLFSGVMASCTDPSLLTRAECHPSLEPRPLGTPSPPLPLPRGRPSDDTAAAAPRRRHLALAHPPPPPPSQLPPPLAGASWPPSPRPLPPSPRPEGVEAVEAVADAAGAAGREQGARLRAVAPPLTTPPPPRADPAEDPAENLADDLADDLADLADLADEILSRRPRGGGPSSQGGRLSPQGGRLPHGHSRGARRSLKGGGGDKSGGDRSKLEVQWLNANPQPSPRPTPALNPSPCPNPIPTPSPNQVQWLTLALALTPSLPLAPSRCSGSP